MRPRRTAAVRAGRWLAGAVALAAPHAAALDPPLPCDGCTRFPPTTAAWQWQLRGRIDVSVRAAVFDIDGADADPELVRALKTAGRRVVCYFSAGTWEAFRDDAAGFPEEVRGKPLEDYPDERWLDVRRIDLLAPVLLARLEACRAKGFDAVEPDNVDAWDNDTGFPLAADDQLAFDVWIANEAHRRGLAVGLKNDAEQVPQLVPYFDFAVVEQCFQFRECDRYLPFVEAGKAVFVAEYRVPPARFCRRSRRLGLSAIFKRPGLGRFRRTCPGTVRALSARGGPG
jgi:hypothetical protein